MSVADGETRAVSVCSRSFSRHPTLSAELLARDPDARLNSAGLRLTGEALREHLQGATHAIVALERIDAPLLDALPDLRVVSKFGVGLDGLDLDALADRNIELGWTGGVNRRAVAELVVAQSINLLRNLYPARDQVRAGGWPGGSGRELGARTVGLIGCGFVGKAVAQLLRAFGCRVLSHDLRDFPEFYARTGVEAVDLDTVLAESEILSLHVPLDASTTHLLNTDRLARMRPGALLINTARGGIVDEAALYDALLSGHLGGAAFDVLADEPPDSNRLLSLDTFVCTPHLAGSTDEALLGMGRAAIRGLDDHLPIAEHRRRWASPEPSAT